MDSIFESRIFYNWRMAKRGGAYLVGSLIAAGAAGAFAAVAHNAVRSATLGISPGLGLAGFVALCAVAALLWWRFSSLQDEMFHRIQNASYCWGAAASIAVLIVWGIANGAGLAPAIDPLAPLIIFALAKCVVWRAATRKWL